MGGGGAGGQAPGNKWVEMSTCKRQEKRGQEGGGYQEELQHCITFGNEKADRGRLLAVHLFS